MEKYVYFFFKPAAVLTDVYAWGYAVPILDVALLFEKVSQGV